MVVDLSKVKTSEELSSAIGGNMTVVGKSRSTSRCTIRSSRTVGTPAKAYCTWRRT